MTDHPTLLLAGCGKMGSAMLQGWIEDGLPPENACIVEPSENIREHLTSELGVKTAGNVSAFSEVEPDVVILAVKPQAMDGVVPDYSIFVRTGTAFLSIAAGKPIGYFETRLGEEAAIVRAMPNTPAAVGRGITVCCANAQVADAQKSLCQTLLEAVGVVEWVEDEGLIDAVTALSGGGPAYVFLLTESLAEAGEKAGLPRDLARRLARETVSGAGELMRLADDEPETLRKNVTSPGGTTAEALQVLMDPDTGWQSIVNDAIAAATRRSRELA